jgi:hypothetical protein
MKKHLTKAERFFSPRAAIVALALTLSATAVYAEGTEAQRQACTGDVFRLCSSDIPNVDRIVACLKANKPKLSPACGQVFGGTQTATRSLADNSVDFCAFTPGSSEPSNQNWKTWCGPSAH